MKLKLVLAYDGSFFQGSSTQPHKNSVADALHQALKHLGIFDRPLFASRTDKGVHALNAVASVKCKEHFKDMLFLKNQINRFAKPHIYIKHIKRVDDNFQVRFDVKKRQYRYIFYHGNFNPFLSSYYYFYPQFDIVKANEALTLFIGTHNFEFFAKAKAKNTTKTIFQAYAYAYKQISVFHFSANAFLRAQIRLSVAAILKVLENKLSLKELQEQIKAEKIHSRNLVPPNGLYLSRILY